MEKTDQLPLPGSRQLNLKKSFQLGIRSLLTACSQEDISKMFPKFSHAEQQSLYRLLIQVISSLHENIEDEFQSICLETKACTILDTVEQLVEEHSLDSLSSDKTTTVADVWLDVSTVKKKEIQHLMDMLEMAHKQNCAFRARVDQLRKEMRDFSGTGDVIGKMNNGVMSYATSNSMEIEDA